jgi:hypothetical protein
VFASLALLWCLFAATFAVYAYFGWRTAKRWNTLLRRSGKAADDEVISRTSTLLGFVFGDAYREFGDERLSRLVRATRISGVATGLMLCIWFVAVKVR